MTDRRPGRWAPAASPGAGTPTARAELRPGEVVLDRGAFIPAGP